jgi:ferric-dicitrate binding protein FerR (iron transport regulator)
VKLDHDSAAVLDSRGRLTLDHGAVFVDAEPAARDNDFYVSTPLGVVRHLGTQFEVRLDVGGLRIRVREGTVAIENADGRWVSREGEALRVTRGRPPERRSIFTYGSEWGWVDELAPPFVLEGSTLGAFLHWASRHHGLRWQYADPELRDRVARIVLHGSIEGLSGEEAFAAVLRTCGLTFRRSGEQLIIAKVRAQ